MSNQELSPEDLNDLQVAKWLLENPSLAARLVNVFGAPIEYGLKHLPASIKEIISSSTTYALGKALQFAISTMRVEQRKSSNWIHKTAVMTTGAIGGAGGLFMLPVELPISTTIMLRSIADVARSEGENIATVEAKLACIEVFALGGRSSRDDSADTGYFAVRSMLARSITEAAEYIANRSVIEETAPPLLRLLAQISTRFGVQVSEKAMAQLVPVIGAVGGAFVNMLFINHFQDVARGHFTVRRLERKYGEDVVKVAYDAIPNDGRGI